MPYTLFKALGLIAWTACIMVLGYQTVTWTFTATWPSLTLMDIGGRLGFDLISLIRSLPLEFAIKGAYVLITTQLSVALWWAGAAFFVLAFLSAIIVGR
ncbi:potassium:proton antiporter [Pseudodesulfovibrio pelocollis]|uniref:potassium:proton antiporter n=1 Tax=Pseudodesulfovibrio pelocollis TaxID=3051432 RepID=UPI00255AE682|nr:potassium:proton antiporter [Pseudodesulfovibrio sp. SB368]